MLCLYVIIDKKRKEKQFPPTPIFGILQSPTHAYDKIIDQLDFLTLECPSCKHSGCLIKHAKYPRTFRMANSIITVHILRVLCKECGHTHAILLCDFVPYSQILLDDQVDILTSNNDEEFLSDNPNFDLSDIRYIRKQYNLYWKQRLLSRSIS